MSRWQEAEDWFRTAARCIGGKESASRAGRGGGLLSGGIGGQPVRGGVVSEANKLGQIAYLLQMTRWGNVDRLDVSTELGTGRWECGREVLVASSHLMRRVK